MNPTLREHNPPHVHVEYAGETCAILISNGTLFDGSIPANQLKKVQEFVMNHSKELNEMWDTMNYVKIDPTEEEKCTNTESAK